MVVVVLIAVFGTLFMICMPGRSHSGPLPAMTPEERALQERLHTHVKALAGDIGARSLLVPDGLNRAAEYVEAEFQRLGLEVKFQPYEVRGKEVKNIEVEWAGDSLPEEIVVIGAHYDGVLACPAANDNASGVAALFEIARLLHGRRLARTVRFVAFVNEEPPYFATENMGSHVYAQRSKKRGENIVAMIALETIGYYAEEKGSQHYPPPFSFFYPDRGNFIGFVGNLSSRGLVRQCIASFRSHTPFPSEGVTAPAWIGGIHWSDHRSFWNAGYPALMITDTALFRYAHYHTAQDTPGKLTYEGFARVVAGITRVVAEVAGSDGP